MIILKNPTDGWCRLELVSVDEDDLAQCCRLNANMLDVAVTTDSAAARLTLCVSLLDDELLTEFLSSADDVTTEPFG